MKSHRMAEAERNREKIVEAALAAAAKEAEMRGAMTNNLANNPQCISEMRGGTNNLSNNLAALVSTNNVSAMLASHNASTMVSSHNASEMSAMNNLSKVPSNS
jgi:hypothetical protein